MFSKTPISGARVGESLETFLIQIPHSTVVIGFNPSFWRYRRQTSYRSAVRAIAEQVTESKFPYGTTRTPMLMIWSKEEWVLDDQRAVRVVTHARAKLEYEVIWNWIGFVTSLPIARQRSRKLHEEFDRWWSEQSKKLTMPELPSH